MTKTELTSLLPVVRRYAYSLTGSMPDADDLLQNTLERVLSRPVPMDVELVKWVFRICRNLWIDEYRSRKVRQTAHQKPELYEEQRVDGEHAIYKEIELDRVNLAMEQLPADQRSMISLVAIQGMSYKEMAETLEIPMGTVMSRLARARAALCETVNAAPARISA